MRPDSYDVSRCSSIISSDEPMTKVLIIDDQPVFRSQLKKLLSYAKMTIVGEAKDIPTAVDLVRKTRPDIAFIDVMLPGENGLEGTRILKKIHKKMRVILVSAHHDSADLYAKSAREIGAEAFIPKDELDLDMIKKFGFQ